MCDAASFGSSEIDLLASSAADLANLTEESSSYRKNLLPLSLKLHRHRKSFKYTFNSSKSLSDLSIVFVIRIKVYFMS
ncbi:hypothetical protein L1987_79628 [Smallanthus sonchifolius]|uniref:Uncharacterized protein n=1 Tax=Smallanthus sonchifolius TaxID=185202 RepID=A0ACB8YLX4_9ASTR|nr:hypothetical protein L1987_79628 [Smallanthus sonchifolius]